MPAKVSKNMTDNLKKLISLAKADGGKFFVIDENGEPQLVIMSIADYEKVLLKKIQNQIENIEEINLKIIEAQTEQGIHNSEQEQLKSEVIDSTFLFEGPIHSQGEYEEF